MNTGKIFFFQLFSFGFIYNVIKLLFIIIVLFIDDFIQNINQLFYLNLCHIDFVS